jgi:hypothetical protein
LWLFNDISFPSSLWWISVSSSPTEILSVIIHSASSPWSHVDSVVHVDILTTNHQKFPPRGPLAISGQF